MFDQVLVNRNRVATLSDFRCDKRPMRFAATAAGRVAERSPDRLQLCIVAVFAGGFRRLHGDAPIGGRS